MPFSTAGVFTPLFRFGSSTKADTQFQPQVDADFQDIAAGLTLLETQVGSTGSGSAPGGTAGNVQYNNSGIFGGYTDTQLTSHVNLFTATTSGAAPLSGGGTANYLRADGAWAAPAVGTASSTPPGGSNLQIQYNNASAFGGLTDTQVTARINVFTSTLKGATPQSGGGTLNFLRADGNWTTPSGTANYVSITDFGGVGNNSTDNTTPLNNALASLTGSGGVIFFPPGKYKFNSAITFNFPATNVFSVTLMGCAQDAVILTWPNAAGGITFNLSTNQHAVNVRDMSLTTSQAAGGTALNITNSTAFGLSGNDFRNLFIAGEDRAGLTNYWTTGISFSQVSAINVDAVTIIGNSTGASGTGIDIDGGASNSIISNIQRSNFLSLGKGIILGTGVQGVTVEACNFTNGTIGIFCTTSLTGLDELCVASSQFNTKGDGVQLNSAFGNIMLTGSLYIVASSKVGINIPLNNNFVISNNIFVGESGVMGTGVTIGTTGGETNVVIGNTFTLLVTGIDIGGNIVNMSGNSIAACTTGLVISSTKVNINGNCFNGNSTAISNSGTNIRITNNIGYNPVGVAAISPTGSPFTYTAGASPETVYIYGGTVSEVDFAVNGGALTTVASQSSPCTVHLGPNDQLKVTYSSAPGMNKMVH